MADQARITSIEALESFRASLIVYLSKARPALDEVCDEVRRTRMWLENDRWSHWQNEVRLRGKELEQAREELSSAQCSNLKVPSMVQQRAVTRAQLALREAEEKLRFLRKWIREFENLTSPQIRQLDQLHTFLTVDMAHAVAVLAQTVRTLDAYAGIAPSIASAGTTGSDAANNTDGARPESGPPDETSERTP